jgi:hypothetical protein
LEDVTELTNALANRFIQRRDVKAIQKQDMYMPVTDTGKVDGQRLPWTRDDLVAHVQGERSYGHYLVDREGNCKLFAFDLDLAQPDPRVERDMRWVGIEPDGSYTDMEPKKLNPRAAWQHPEGPENLRRFLVAQLRETAELLAAATYELLSVPVAVAYSGNKGLHVYGFTGAAPAEDVQAAALEVISYIDKFEPLRGKCFFKAVDEEPKRGLGCVETEVFPKQTNLDGKDLGNLMRLPLGRNTKSGQRSYFLNLNSPIDELVELDPLVALQGGNPWQEK